MKHPKKLWADDVDVAQEDLFVSVDTEFQIINLQALHVHFGFD